MRVAWFTSLSKTSALRSAYCSRLLFEVLPSGWDLEAFTGDEDYREAGGKFVEAAPVYHALRFGQRRRQKPFDAVVYLLEDHPRLAFAQRALRTWPGVALCYDTNFNRLVQSQYSKSANGSDFDIDMDEYFGPGAPKLGNQLQRGWSIEAFDRIHRRGKEDLQQCAVVIAPFRAAAPITSAPVLTCGADVVNEEAALSARSRYHLRRESTVVAFFADRVLDDRVVPLLTALESAPPSIQLLWGVSSEVERNAAEKTLRDPEFAAIAAQTRIAIAPTVAEQRALLHAADFSCALQANGGRGPSMWFLLSCELGVPVAISAGDSTSLLPEDVFPKVPLGRGESETMTVILERLCTEAGLLKSLAQKQREFRDAELHPRAVIDRIAGVLDIHRETLAAMRVAGEEQRMRDRAGLLELGGSQIDDAIFGAVSCELWPRK